MNLSKIFIVEITDINYLEGNISETLKEKESS